jgi:cytochrome-b5 reductase
MERFPVSSTSSVLRFALPDKTQALHLSTCACILANADIDGEGVTRPYTPISTNAMIGCFDLLVKNYGPTAKMSRHLHEIKPGEMINFKHISFNVKIQAPFPYNHICMIVGGTGITPMIQALHAILGGDSNNKKKQKVTMLYGSRVSDDILGKELLDKWQADHADQFTCVHVLSHEPDDSDWKGARGFVDKAKIEKYFPPSNNNNNDDDDSSFCIFVCGPPPMYNALTGPRDEPDSVKGVLGEMGYKPNQVYKF